VRFKHEQPQVLSPDSHVTVGTIQQKEEATDVLWVYRLNQVSHCRCPPRSVLFSSTSDCLGL